MVERQFSILKVTGSIPVANTTAFHLDSLLISRRWRNGRRDGLKLRSEMGGGSSPSLRTTSKEVRVLAVPRTNGAVAQLGERLVCNQEVIGSIPFSSTRY